MIGFKGFGFRPTSIPPLVRVLDLLIPPLSPIPECYTFLNLEVRWVSITELLGPPPLDMTRTAGKGYSDGASVEAEDQQAGARNCANQYWNRSVKR